jgi:hypothetical protein
MVDMGNAFKIVVGKWDMKGREGKEREHSEDLGVDGGYY